MPNRRLERTRHEPVSLVRNLGEPLKRIVGWNKLVVGWNKFGNYNQNIDAKYLDKIVGCGDHLCDWRFGRSDIVSLSTTSALACNGSLCQSSQFRIGVGPLFRS